MKTEIIFRTKVETLETPMGDREYVNIPTLTRTHCNMWEMRQHPKYGSYANSALFSQILARIARETGTDTPYGLRLYLDSLPDNVIIERGFLAKVAITV